MVTIPASLDIPVNTPVIFAQYELDEGESLESSDSKLFPLAAAIEAIPAVTTVQSTSRRSGGELSIIYDPELIKPDNLIEEIKRPVPRLLTAFFISRKTAAAERSAFRSL